MLLSRAIMINYAHIYLATAVHKIRQGLNTGFYKLVDSYREL